MRARPPVPRARFLTSAQAARVYDRIGRFQDVQALYEHRAVEELLAHGDFEHASAVLELGHGTGALAARLLDGRLPAGAAYTGVDVSPHMHELAQRRLRPHAGRVELRLTEGSLTLPDTDASFDRFLSTYVLDLLPDPDVDTLLGEAARVLAPGGLLCLAGLTPGATPAARLVTSVWERLWSLRPGLVGGCRPLRLAGRLDPDAWTIRRHAVVTTLAISSEVLVAARNAQATGPRERVDAARGPS